MTTSTVNFNQSIQDKLNYFLETKKVPNIIFHGACGSGKRTIVNNFVYEIYDKNKGFIQTYVMNINCAHGKGIKFVREELKLFAKSHINNNGINNNNGNINYFKTIILSNADKLTIDAQSALRRCIELFSHNTRFFIIVEDKYKLLKPIISRFCEIFISEPTIGTKPINLHKYNIQQLFDTSKYDKSHENWLTKKIQEYLEKKDIKKTELFGLSIQLYEKGYSGLDLMNYIEKDHIMDMERKYHLLLFFQKIKKDIRNEKLFILFILNFLFFRCEKDLENISFM